MKKPLIVLPLIVLPLIVLPLIVLPLIVLPLIFLIGCLTTGEVYLPHTSRIFHKKNCVALYDPSPIKYSSVQAAINSGGVKPCIVCIKTNQNTSSSSYKSTSTTNSSSYPSQAASNQNTCSSFFGTLFGSFLGAAASSANSNYSSTPSYSETYITPDYMLPDYNYNYQLSGIENQLREMNYQNQRNAYELRKGMAKPYDYYNRGGDWMYGADWMK